MEKDTAGCRVFFRNYIVEADNMTERRKPRSYTDELKQPIVQLYHNGKRKCDICREYDIATSLLDKCNESKAQNIVIMSNKVTVSFTTGGMPPIAEQIL